MKQRLQCPYRAKNTDFTKIAQKKSLNNNNNNKTNEIWEEGKYLISFLYNILRKISSFQNSIVRHGEIKYGPYTEKKK